MRSGSHLVNSRKVKTEDTNVTDIDGKRLGWGLAMVMWFIAAFRALKVNVGGTVVEALRQTQRSDGSWANPENLVKEDDPLIATPFAIHALVAGLDAR